MKNDRNMYFPGMSGMMPMSPMGPMGQMGPGYPGGMMPNMSQTENRIAALERQLKRLETRVSRLETPYPTPTFPSGPGIYQPTEMQQPEQSFPYQPSMQMM